MLYKYVTQFSIYVNFYMFRHRSAILIVSTCTTDHTCYTLIQALIDFRLVIEILNSRTHNAEKQKPIMWHLSYVRVSLFKYKFVAVYIVGSMYICLDLCDPEGFRLDRACEVYLVGRCVVCLGGYMGLGTVPVGQVPHRPNLRTKLLHAPFQETVTLHGYEDIKSHCPEQKFALIFS